MNFHEYIKKVYTIAFRLTGEEISACDVAALAVDRNANNIKEDDIDLSILHTTAKEVCGIFLLEPDKYSVSINHSNHIQNTLLALEPLSRAAVVWRDIMGFNINDLASISNCTKSELYKKLNSARKQMLRSAGQ
jgi:hypothetical protein